VGGVRPEQWPGAGVGLALRAVSVDRGMEQSLDLLLERRSAKTFTGEPPTREQLEQILRAATSVPDHGRMQPWRFTVISGAGRERFADALADAGPPEAREKLRSKAFVAPTMIVLATARKHNPKVPHWEQEASVAAAGYAITLAAHALGLGAVWKSAPVRRGAALNELLGIAADEEILGWVNVGVPGAVTGPGTAPTDLTDVVRVVDGGAPRPWGA
jgi:nitroreductase